MCNQRQSVALHGSAASGNQRQFVDMETEDGEKRRKAEWQFCTARISNYIKRKDKSDFVAVGIGQERLEKCYLATVGLMRMCSGFSAARESAFLATSSSLYLPLSETDDTEKGGDGRHGERRSAA